MTGVIYYTFIDEKYRNRKLEHMAGEKLLQEGLLREYGLSLASEPRALGEHGKPFFTLHPEIHYNITHSGKYAACIFADCEVGLDIQEHRRANHERMLERMVPACMVRELLDCDEPEKAFFTQWVLREAYIKWTGEGLSRELATIPMDRGSYLLLELEPGYSGAVWSGEELELRYEYLDTEPDTIEKKEQGN